MSWLRTLLHWAGGPRAEDRARRRAAAVEARLRAVARRLSRF